MTRGRRSDRFPLSISSRRRSPRLDGRALLSNFGVELPTQEVVFTVPVDLPTSLTPMEIDAIREGISQQIAINTAVADTLHQIRLMLIELRANTDDEEIVTVLNSIIDDVTARHETVVDETYLLYSLMEWLDSVDPRLNPDPEIEV